MSIFNVLRGQFIDIIEWTEPAQNDILAYRFPRFNNEIKMGAKLVVREGQIGAVRQRGAALGYFHEQRHVHADDGKHADPFHAQGLEIRFQFAVQGGGLFHLDAAMDGSEMGHAESDHAARSGVRPGAGAGVRHAMRSTWRTRRRSSSNSSSPTRCLRRLKFPISSATRLSRGLWMRWGRRRLRCSTWRGITTRSPRWRAR